MLARSALISLLALSITGCDAPEATSDRMSQRNLPFAQLGPADAGTVIDHIAAKDDVAFYGLDTISLMTDAELDVLVEDSAGFTIDFSTLTETDVRSIRRLSERNHMGRPFLIQNATNSTQMMDIFGAGVEADLVKANPPDKRLGHGPSAGAVERLDRAPGRCQARNLRLEDEVHRNADRDGHAGQRLRDERIERADVLFSVGPGLAEDPEHRD